MARIGRKGLHTMQTGGPHGKSVFGAVLRKEVAQMEQFLLDVAAQVVASVIVALFVYLTRRR